jgi:hypothetical protein
MTMMLKVMCSTAQVFSMLILAGISRAQSVDAPDSAVPQVKHTQNSTVIPVYEVFELAFQHESQYENPFFDVTIDVTLTAPSSKRRPPHAGI